MIKLCIIDTIGLQYDGETLNKKGLGGSESAVILISKELAKIGFDVTVFNDCNGIDSSEGIYKNVKYLPIRQENIDSEKFDIVLSSRSTLPFTPKEYKEYHNKYDSFPDFSNMVKDTKKILWLHDTFCQGDNILEHLVETGLIDKIFTLSDFHTNYIANCDHGRRRNFEVLKNKIFQTRNGIVKHLDWVDIKKKDRNLFVYNSSTSKGLVPLITSIWPKIKERLPEAKLKVIGGFYRFKDSLPDEQELKYNELVSSNPIDVEFTGIIKQNEIADILASASFMLYPASFPETFGISALESLNYNTPLLTCRFGALEETAIDDACYKIPYAIEPNGLFPNINVEWQEAAFANMVVNAYNNTYLHQHKMYACNKLKDICTWDTIALQWKQHFYRILGLYLPIAEYRKVSKINHKVHEVFGRRFMNKEDNIYYKSKLEKRIVVISPVYNGEKYIEKCIKSVTSQDYNNYEHIIVDDCSTDNTLDNIYDIKDLDNIDTGKLGVLVNPEHRGSALYYQIRQIEYDIRRNPYNCIFILLDGDDSLVNDPNIFNKINDMYYDGAEMTYGSCWSMIDNIPLIAQDYPPEIKNNKSYRDWEFTWQIPFTHLRTFSSELFEKGIDLYLLKDSKGEYFKAGGDAALFYALIEKADPNKVVAVPEVWVNYNDSNPTCDYKINSEEQRKTLEIVLG